MHSTFTRKAVGPGRTNYRVDWPADAEGILDSITALNKIAE
jgi:hypothetical protein